MQSWRAACEKPPASSPSSTSKWQIRRRASRSGNLDRPAFLAVAGRVGNARLIDNIHIDTEDGRFGQIVGNGSRRPACCTSGSPMTILALDIGNTHTEIGVFDGDRLVHHWRISTRWDRTADEYLLLFADCSAPPAFRPARMERCWLLSFHRRSGRFAPPLRTWSRSGAHGWSRASRPGCPWRSTILAKSALIGS